MKAALEPKQVVLVLSEEEAKVLLSDLAYAFRVTGFGILLAARNALAKALEP